MSLHHLALLIVSIGLGIDAFGMAAFAIYAIADNKPETLIHTWAGFVIIVSVPFALAAGAVEIASHIFR